MKPFSMIRRCVLAGLMVAGTAAPAAASADPAVAAATQERIDAAQARADAARARADFLARVGQGSAYKSGAIDSAKAEAYSAQAEADAWRTFLTTPPPPASTALDDAQDRLDYLKAQGGWAYKSGAVFRAEAEVNAQRAAEGIEVEMGMAQPPAGSPDWGKPVERTWLRTYR
jgi:hypothetical protein